MKVNIEDKKNTSVRMGYVISIFSFVTGMTMVLVSISAGFITELFIFGELLNGFSVFVVLSTVIRSVKNKRAAKKRKLRESVDITTIQGLLMMGKGIKMNWLSRKLGMSKEELRVYIYNLIGSINSAPTRKVCPLCGDLVGSAHYDVNADSCLNCAPKIHYDYPVFEPLQGN